MKILGIDYGRSKIGLAITDGTLAEPLVVLKYKDVKELVKRIKTEIEKGKIDKIVIGVSEGKMAVETEKFIRRLNKEINIPVEEYDETLTSRDAQFLSIQAGINRKKRRKMEDAYAATIILQNYLDSD